MVSARRSDFYRVSLRFLCERKKVYIPPVCCGRGCAGRMQAQPLPTSLPVRGRLQRAALRYAPARGLAWRTWTGAPLCLQAGVHTQRPNHDQSPRKHITGSYFGADGCKAGGDSVLLGGTLGLHNVQVMHFLFHVCLKHGQQHVQLVDPLRCICPWQGKGAG